MADQEEQELETEALQSIFEEEFSWIAEPTEFEVKLAPVVEEGVEVHVEAALGVKFLENYPSEAIPEYTLRSVKGLSAPLLEDMKEIAVKSSTDEIGGPVVYNVCEALKDWLGEHNEPGQDDNSMYSVMMRKEAAKEAAEREKNQTGLGSGKGKDSEEAQAAAKEKARLKARAEGDPVTADSFAAWKEAFEQEMRDEILAAQAAGKDLSSYDSYAKSLVFEKKNKDKLTGKQLFQEKKAEAVKDEGDAEEDEDEDETIFRKIPAGEDFGQSEDDDSDYVPSDDDA